jgi:hypothetical protein
MTEERTEKPERVQFPKGSTAKEILGNIKKIQDDWAKRNPEKAHRMYPKVYDIYGQRIK